MEGLGEPETKRFWMPFHIKILVEFDNEIIFMNHQPGRGENACENDCFDSTLSELRLYVLCGQPSKEGVGRTRGKVELRKSIR